MIQVPLENPLLKNIENNRTVTIEKSPFTIGRAISSDFLIENRIISRKHCEFNKTPEGWTVTDSSTNGILINGEHLLGGTSAILNHNDEISLGYSSFTYIFLTHTEKPCNAYVERLKNEENASTSKEPNSGSSSPCSFEEQGVSDDLLNNLADVMLKSCQNETNNVQNNQGSNENNLIPSTSKTKPEETSSKSQEIDHDKVPTPLESFAESSKEPIEPSTSKEPSSKESSAGTRQSNSTNGTVVYDLPEDLSVPSVSAKESSAGTSQSNSANGTVVYDLPEDLSVDIDESRENSSKLRSLLLNSDNETLVQDEVPTSSEYTSSKNTKDSEEVPVVVIDDSVDAKTTGSSDVMDNSVIILEQPSTSKTTKRKRKNEQHVKEVIELVDTPTTSKTKPQKKSTKNVGQQKKNQVIVDTVINLTNFPSIQQSVSNCVINLVSPAAKVITTNSCLNVGTSVSSSSNPTNTSPVSTASSNSLSITSSVINTSQTPTAITVVASPVNLVSPTPSTISLPSSSNSNKKIKVVTVNTGQLPHFKGQVVTGFAVKPGNVLVKLNQEELQKILAKQKNAPNVRTDLLPSGSLISKATDKSSTVPGSNSTVNWLPKGFLVSKVPNSSATVPGTSGTVNCLPDGSLSVGRVPDGSSTLPGSSSATNCLPDDFSSVEVPDSSRLVPGLMDAMTLCEESTVTKVPDSYCVPGSGGRNTDLPDGCSVSNVPGNICTLPGFSNTMNVLTTEDLCTVPGLITTTAITTLPSTINTLITLPSASSSVTHNVPSDSSRVNSEISGSSSTEILDNAAVPVPVQEVEVYNTATELTDVGASAVNTGLPTVKMHVSQEPGPSKVVQQNVVDTKQCSNQNQFEEMEDELLCTICANLFIKPVTLECSHSFCQYCIGTWKKKKSDCPICRKKITSVIRTLILDNIIEKMLENAPEDVRKQRKESVEERAKLIEAEEAEKKKKENQNSGRNSNRGRGRGGANNRGNGRRNNNARRQNAPAVPPVVEQPAPPVPIIDIADSPSTTDTDEDSFNSDYDYDDYMGDDWYNGRPGAYYGGYGRCYNCGDPGHWANGCPYR